MTTEIFTCSYPCLPFCERDILRYAQCRSADTEILALLHSCMEQMQDQLRYKICYCTLPVRTDEAGCDFSLFRADSISLSRHLQNVDQVLLFAATLGIGPDRLLTRASRLSPAQALFYQAIGASQIETLCNQFCQDMTLALNCPLLPRFSPGYGDLPLETQRDIFRLLSCERKIGLTLNESLLMSPSKSVTAFVGISRQTDH